MTRLVASAVLATVTSVLWPGVAGIHAQAEDFLPAVLPAEPHVPYDVAYAAARIGLNPWDLHGALISTRATLDQYLASQSESTERPLAAPSAASGPITRRVRLTYYTLSGRTASGEAVRAGGTACSSNWAMGTRFRFPNGETFVCNDRGILGNTGWLDVWGRPDLQRRYGSYVDVEVLN